VQLFTGDSAGAPAVARTKMQELVERDNVSCLIGPLATAEALAIDDYIRDKQIPTLSVAAAEDMTSARRTRGSAAPPRPRRSAPTRWATTRRRN
jgi:branched-chain amino acid transport system substrate-binding protein